MPCQAGNQHQNWKRDMSQCQAGNQNQYGFIRSDQNRIKVLDIYGQSVSQSLVFTLLLILLFLLDSDG